jgi:tRNA nucleotidyltransferase (CCA-adding enzyme)
MSVLRPKDIIDPGLVLFDLAAGAAQPGGWLDAETLLDMKKLVDGGGLSQIDPAETWAYLAKGLMGEQPSRMFIALRACGALARLLPEVDALFGHFQSADESDQVDIGEHQWRVVDKTASRQAALPVRFAALLFNLGKSDSPPQHLPAHYRHVERCLPRIAAICARFKVAPELRELALLVAEELERVHRAARMRAASITALLERVDAFARPGRYLDLLTVCACDYAAYQGNEGKAYPKSALLERAREACLAVDQELMADDASSDRVRRHELRAIAVAGALRSERWAEEGTV